jgi:FkbM family methyltransferase
MHIVQVGCHTGDDQFFDLVKANQNSIEKCIILDALSSSVDICRSKYEKIFSKDLLNKTTFLKKAVVDNDLTKSISFYCTENEHLDNKDIKYTAFSSTDISHLRSHGVANIKSIEVEAVSLNNLFKEFNLKKIDRLYLDAEGLDASILLSIDFDNVEIDFLCFEAAHTDGPFTRGFNYNSIINKLKEKDYSLYTFLHQGGKNGYPNDQIDWNIWAIKNSSLEKEIIKYSGHEEKFSRNESQLVKI